MILERIRMFSLKVLLNESCLTTSPGKLVFTESRVSNALIAAFWNPYSVSTVSIGIFLFCSIGLQKNQLSVNCCLNQFVYLIRLNITYSII